MTDPRRIFGKAPTMRLPGGGTTGISAGVVAIGDQGNPIAIGPASNADLPFLSIISGAAAGWTINGPGALVVPATGVYLLTVCIGVSTVGTSGYSVGQLFLTGLYGATWGTTVGSAMPLDPAGSYTDVVGSFTDTISMVLGDTIIPNFSPDSQGTGDIWAYVRVVKAYKLG
jgi:hypothetical protein